MKISEADNADLAISVLHKTPTQPLVAVVIVAVVTVAE